MNYRYTREERSLQVRRYWIYECQTCPVQGRCTYGTERRITRWQHEDLLDAARERLGDDPDPMTLRRCTVELDGEAVVRDGRVLDGFTYTTARA